MTTETRSTLSQETIDHLQDLIQINIDSRDGLLEAVEHVDNSTIAAAFRDLASKRNEQSAELSALVAANCEEPQETGSMSAAAHRAWIDLRGALGQGTQAMLNEAERGEDQIKGKYEEVLKASAGSAVTDVLNKQYRDVKVAHDSVKLLRDNYKD